MTTHRIRLPGLALAFLVLLPACRTTGSADGRASESLNSALWVQTSAEYDAVAEQSFLTARERLGEALDPANESWTAAVEQAGDYSSLPPAVILDLDEAILDNAPFQAHVIEHDGRFVVDSWKRWVRQERAGAVPGALDFVRHAHELGVRVFYVSNRRYELEEATVGNLQKLGFPVDPDGANILSRHERGELWDSDKHSRREFVAKDHRVVLIVGDDLNDFVSGARTDPESRVALAQRYRGWWGRKWILLPNPSYGGWERALYDYDESLTREQRLDRKYQQLDRID